MKRLSTTGMSYRNPRLAWGILALLFISCSVPPVLVEQDCTVPPAPCKPASFDQVLIDTEFVTEGWYLYSIELLPRPVNTDANDHAIIFYSDGGNRYGLVTNDSTPTGVQHISQFVSPQYIPSEKSSDLHLTSETISSGAPWYSAAEKKLYFTAKNQTEDPSDYDIYQASLNQQQYSLWSSDRVGGIYRERSFDAQATISRDGLKMYFASERNGGAGGVDIWMSSRSAASSAWSEPKPLYAVNTLCNELSPSVSYDGKWLYFASNGHSTVGGYDIFRAKLDEQGIPQAPENIGKLVNTEYDELFPYEPADSLLYYSSDQPASIGKRNLYVLHRTKINPKLAALYRGKIRERDLERIKPDAFPNDTTPIRLEGNVVIAGDTGKVDAEVFWRDPQKDVELGRKPTDTSGNYAINLPRGKEYDVGAESKDKFYDVRRVDTRNTNDPALRVPTLVIGDTLILRLNFPFDNYTSPYDFTVDDNGEQSAIRWQTHLDLITRSIKHDLKRLAKVVLAGHTDTVGTIAYNDRLSYNRANFVRKELIRRGISALLLQIDPKGESQPFRKREEETIETYHLRLRRVEIVKVLK